MGFEPRLGGSGGGKVFGLSLTAESVSPVLLVQVEELVSQIGYRCRSKLLFSAFRLGLRFLVAILCVFSTSP